MLVESLERLKQDLLKLCFIAARDLCANRIILPSPVCVTYFIADICILGSCRQVLPFVVVRD